MLIPAREARTASKLAPVHHRRAIGTTMVRALFGPSIRWWMHPRGSSVATGSAVGSVTDYSNRGTTISQATGSKQPLKSGKEGVPCFAFDGVNDALVTSTTDLTGTAALTLAIAEYRATSAGGIQCELTADIGAATNGIALVANDNSVVNWETAYNGNAGFQIKAVTSSLAPIQKWGAWVAVANKANPAASELAIYKSGQTISSFFTNVNAANNTNTFANAAWYIGSRAALSSPFIGMLAQIVVISRALSDSEAKELSQYVAQAAGCV
jgi:hypothetical protein